MTFISSVLVTSIIMIISSSSWFHIWMSLEINLLSFIGLIINNKLFEATTKYFLIQAMGSSLFIFGSIFSQSNHFLDLLPALAILIKMGSAPFHLWYPEIMNLLNWSHCMILTTAQKLGPLFILSNLKVNVMMFAVMSVVTASISSINQSSLRKLLAFSSINHNGWMLVSIWLNMPTWMMYFLLYSAINIMLMSLFKQNNYLHINQIKPTTISSKMLITTTLISIGGLPPTVGFAPKWIILLDSFQTPLMSFTLIISSLIMLYAYLTLLSSSVFLNHNHSSTMHEDKINSNQWWVIFSLPTLPIMLN